MLSFCFGGNYENPSRAKNYYAKNVAGSTGESVKK